MFQLYEMPYLPDELEPIEAKIDENDSIVV